MFLAALLCMCCGRLVMAEESESLRVEPEAGMPRGEETATPLESALDQGRLHFEQGLRLVQREAWEPALVEFEESLRHNETPVARFNRALCLKNLHRYPEALAAFEEYLERYGAQLDAQRRADVQRMREEIRALLTEVRIEVSHIGASVVVDDDEVGAAPLLSPLLLVSGPHEIEVRLEGYQRETREVVVVAGRPMVERFDLVERARLGRLRIESNVPDARVYVDGDEVGTIPYTGVLAEGEHDVEVHAEGYPPGMQTVAISADEDRIATVTLSRRARVHRGWFWAMVGLTGAGTIGSGVLGGLTLNMADEYDSDPMRSAEDQYAGQRMAVGTDILIGITAVTALAATILGFFTDFGGRGDDADEEQREARALPFTLAESEGWRF